MCNALMLVTFTKGMQKCRSTAEAVVVNNATNFVLSVSCAVQYTVM